MIYLVYPSVFVDAFRDLGSFVLVLVCVANVFFLNVRKYLRFYVRICSFIGLQSYIALFRHEIQFVLRTPGLFRNLFCFVSSVSHILSF